MNLVHFITTYLSGFKFSISCASSISSNCLSSSINKAQVSEHFHEHFLSSELESACGVLNDNDRSRKDIKCFLKYSLLHVSVCVCVHVYTKTECLCFENLHNVKKMTEILISPSPRVLNLKRDDRSSVTVLGFM